MKHNLRKCPKHKYHKHFKKDGQCTKCGGYPQEVRELDILTQVAHLKNKLWVVVWEDEDNIYGKVF